MGELHNTYNENNESVTLRSVMSVRISFYGSKKYEPSDVLTYSSDVGSLFLVFFRVIIATTLLIAPTTNFTISSIVSAFAIDPLLHCITQNQFTTVAARFGRILSTLVHSHQMSVRSVEFSAARDRSVRNMFALRVSSPLRYAIGLPGRFVRYTK